jgi:hypothetical protein
MLEEILLHFGAFFKHIFIKVTYLLVLGCVQAGLSILMHKTMFTLVHVIQHSLMCGVKLIVCMYVCMYLCLCVCMCDCLFVHLGDAFTNEKPLKYVFSSSASKMCMNVCRWKCTLVGVRMYV